MTLSEQLTERFLREPAKFSEPIGDQEAWSRFIAQYPADQLTQLGLEDYCLGRGSRAENFCWWIERGLTDALGRYAPGSARGHLLYRQRDGSIYKHRGVQDLSDENALNHVLRVTHLIATTGSLEEAEKYDEDEAIYEALGLERRGTMGDARKLRIFLAYHPDQIVPINSPAHIEHFLRQFGLEESQIATGPFHRALQFWKVYEELSSELSSLTPYGFMVLLYDDELDIAPKKASAVDVEVQVYEEINRNQILFGPPGTGKTYLTVNKAVEIIDPQYYRENRQNRDRLTARYNGLKEAGKIGFVTFHQSFSYEEFVEGLRAAVDENGQVTYQVEDGIFKRLCEAASSRVTRGSERPIDFSGRRIWKMSLGNTLSEESFVYDECIENGYVLLGYGNDVDFSGCDTREEIYQTYREQDPEVKPNDYAVTSVHNFKNTIQKGDLIVVSDGNQKFRAIGQVDGDYRILQSEHSPDYVQCRDVEWVRVYSPSRPVDELMEKTFSQMTLYELKPTSAYAKKLGMLHSATSANAQPFAVGEQISNYTIEAVGKEIVKLRKPNGSQLDFSWDLLNELARLVREGVITIEDIREKRVFDKADTNLEKYIVNGYQNVLAPLVQQITGGGGERKADEAVQYDARVIIIDEINRGNIAKIFGELITLIEPDKRAGQPEALSVTLPYSKSSFSVPDNLFLIGTLNTADRSLTSIDAALRRRFFFEEVAPDPALLADVEIEGIELNKLLVSLNQRIELLLGREYLIGHSYFLPLKNDPSLGRLKDIFCRQVLPLLKEYFFDDWGKIHQVLGDHAKPPAKQIVRRRFDEAQVVELLGDEGQEVPESAWEINDQALDDPEAYSSIYERPRASNRGE